MKIDSAKKAPCRGLFYFINVLDMVAIPVRLNIWIGNNLPTN